MEGIVYDTTAPAHDPVALMSLAHEVGEAGAQSFLDNYLATLPHRHARVLQTLASGDAKAAMDAVLSLKVSSAVVGAVHLSAFCQGLQDELKSGSLADLTIVTVELDSLVKAFVTVANRYYRNILRNCCCFPQDLLKKVASPRRPVSGGTMMILPTKGRPLGIGMKS